MSDEEWIHTPPLERRARLTSLVGNTELTPVRLPDAPGTVWTKEELRNGVSGSHYDRMAPFLYSLIDNEVLKIGDTVVEPSSGSFLNAISVILRDSGIDVEGHIPHLDDERTAIARAAGARLIYGPGYVPEAAGRMGDERSAMMRAKDGDGNKLWIRDKQWLKEYNMNIFVNSLTGQRRVYLNHTANPGAQTAMQSLPNEVLTQLDSTRLDAAMLAFGNFVTASVLARSFRAVYHTTKLFGFEDELNAPCRDEFYGIDSDIRDYATPTLLGLSAHGTPGLAFKDLSLFDGVKGISERQWQPLQTWFNDTYPHKAVGRTSAAGLALARMYLRNRNDPAANVYVTLFDGADKYKAKQLQ